MRVDKFLKNSRIIKRRTVAKEACEKDRVYINDKLAKPGDNLAVGDRLRVDFGTGSMEVEVLDLREKLKKEEAETLYRIISK